MANAAPPASRVAPPAALTLGLAAIELSRWDREGEAGGELLAVHIWSDLRPLRGAAGLADWRLCGRLSALLQGGRLTGAEGEQLLLPTGGRLPWRMLMVMGLGPRAGFSVARFLGAIGRLFVAVRGLGVHDLAIAPPGRDVEALPAARAAELLLAELRAKPAAAWFRHITVVEPASAHKELGELIPSRPLPRRQSG